MDERAVKVNIKLVFMLIVGRRGSLLPTSPIRRFAEETRVLEMVREGDRREGE